MGYHQSSDDYTLFYRCRGGYITFLVVYIDGIVIIGHNQREIAQLKEKKLMREFKVKDLGLLKYSLGIQVWQLFSL